MKINKEPARNAPARVDPDLGVMRTMMAADRTLMAWIRLHEAPRETAEFSLQ